MSKVKKEHFIFLGLVILFFLPLFKMEYATDTYAIEMMGFNTFAKGMMQNGRLITALGFYIFDWLSLNIVSFYYTSFIFSLLCTYIAVYRLYKILSGKMSEGTSIFLAFFTIVNPLTIEYFLFIEKGFFAFSICMSVLALEGFVRFLRGNRFFLILSFFAILLSALTYQTIPAVFLTLSFVFIIIHSKNIKYFLLNSLIAIAIYGFGMGSDFVFIKLVGKTTRMGANINFSNLAKAFFIIGWPTIFIYIGILSLLFLLCIIISKKKYGKLFTKEAFISFLKTVALCALSLCATYAPFLFVKPNEVWITFRIVYPLGALLGAIPILLCYKKDKTVLKSNPFKKGMLCGTISMIVILIIEFAFFQSLIISRHINNAKDEALCNTIGDKIEDYEAQSGIEIKNIKIYYDESMTKRNPGVFKIGDCNTRAFSKNWSDVDHMNVILGRSFTRKKPDSRIYKEHFYGKNWDSFDSEQLFFDGDTLHICVY